MEEKIPFRNDKEMGLLMHIDGDQSLLNQSQEICLKKLVSEDKV